MMKHTGPMVATLFAMALHPAAWAVNKCTGADGAVTYQDAPCATAAQPEKLRFLDRQTSQVHTERTNKMAEACVQYIRNAQVWKDRASLQIDPPVRGQFTTIVKDGKTQAVVQYLTTVNAKNSYGGYVGAKPAVCYVNAAETRVLSVDIF